MSLNGGNFKTDLVSSDAGRFNIASSTSENCIAKELCE